MDELVEAASRARHDLGKYVAFETRFVGLDATPDELRAALRNDLTRTRRGANGDEGCAAVWARLRPSLQGLELATIDGAVAALADGAARLDALDAAALRALAGAALALADVLRDLHRDLARAQGEG